MKVRDPIHDFVEYDECEEAVMNSAAMQRLRRVKQLAMASLVYPGAVHTRFEHSIGVMHVAGRVAEHLGLDQHARRVVRLAGLLHDVGHGPFSHVSEGPLARFTRQYAQGLNVETSKVHECVTADVVRINTEIGDALGGDLAAEVGDLLDPSVNGIPRVERDIVSGPLDADKFDYLLRDSYYAGVRYGVFDLARMIASLTKCEETLGSYLVVDHESVWAAEQYLMASYHMMAQVYTHRIRRISDALLTRAIEYAAEDDVGEVRRLYTYHPGDEDYLNLYLSYDDGRLLQEIETRGAGSRSAQIIRKLLLRDLPRQVYRTRVADLPPLFARQLGHREMIERLELKVANECSKKRDMVVVDLLGVDPPEPTADVEGMRVKAPSGHPEEFSQHSAIFKGPSSPVPITLSVYVPMEAATRTEMKQEKDQLEAKVRTLIEAEAGGRT